VSQGNEREPAAELGLLDATMIGMGAMIGAGIFVLTGLAAEIAGPAAILVFALNGVVTTFTGLSYAELASAIPKSGGGYAFVREVFADLPAYLMGWMLWFSILLLFEANRKLALLLASDVRQAGVAVQKLE
jgi:amino acid transporter